MKNDKFDIDTVARLAMLRLTPEEKERFGRQLGDILDYMDTLNELDTNGVEPLKHVVELKTPFRADVAGKTLDRAKALGNAPSHEDGFFKTPKVKD